MIARFLWRTWLRPMLGLDFIGTTAAIIGGLAAAGSSVAGGAMASSAAKKAAKAQADAANQAAELQHQDAQAALDFQKQQYGDTLRFMSPYYNTGTSALGNLGFLMGLRPSSQVLTPGGPMPNLPPFRPQGAAAVPQTNRAMFMGPGTDIPGRTTQPAPGNLLPGNGGATNALPNADEGSFGTPRDANDLPPGLGQGGTFVPSQQTSAPGERMDGAGPNVDPVTGLPNDNAFLVQPEAGAQPDANAGGAFGELMAPWTEQFKAPTDITEQNDPGFQFRLKQGQEALERSAAARGSLLTGGTAKDLTNYAQDYASNEYNNVYGRALNEYQQRYNTFKQNQNDRYNRLASLAGLGQTTAGQLSSAGQNMANNASSILMNSGQQIGNDIQNAAFQRGSGYVNSANAWNNTLGGLGNLGMLSYLMTKH